MKPETNNTPNRVAVEYGDNILVVADTDRRVNVCYWNGSLYHGEAIAIIPMPPTDTGVKWFNHIWVAHFLDYEGDPATMEFDTLLDALEVIDERAERLLRNALLYRGIVEEGEIK